MTKNNRFLINTFLTVIYQLKKLLIKRNQSFQNLLFPLASLLKTHIKQRLYFYFLGLKINYQQNYSTFHSLFNKSYKLFKKSKKRKNANNSGMEDLINKL